MNIDKNIVVYAIIAIVVLVGVFLYASSVLTPTYSMTVQLQQGNLAQLNQLENAMNPNVIFPYQTSVLKLYVNNTGSSTISNMTIVLYLNGVKLQSFNLQSLPPNQNILRNLSYTYPAAGNFMFQAIADPAHLYKIQNRQSAQSNLTINITPAQIPDVFLTVPNNNISGVESFALQPVGTATALYFYNNYTLGFTSGIFNGNTFPLLQILKVSAQYIPNFVGAQAKYKNGTSAYTAWIQSGVVTLPAIKSFLNQSGFKVVNATIRQRNGLFLKTNATTSLCFIYSRGWVKVLAYNNASTSSTCANIENTTYTDTESNTLFKQLQADPVMYNWQNLSASSLSSNNPTFIYKGAQQLGRSVMSTNGSVGIVNFFAISSNSTQRGGLFAGLISRSVQPANTAQRPCFDGLVYTNNMISICSAYTPTVTGWLGPILLLNSTFQGSIHTVSLYSLVNDSQAAGAHFDATLLAASLGLNESHIAWKSMFANSCVFSTPSSNLGCTFVGVNASRPSITMNVINNNTSSITINKMNCYYAAPPTNVTVGITLQPHQTAGITVPCRMIPPTGFVAGFALNMTMYYTINNQNKTASGLFNFTTFS